MEENFSIMKNDILGKDYSLSIACVDEKTSRKINKKYRKKNEPTDILSFAISEKMGEIFICKEIARKKKNSVPFLVIHGSLHLKGFEHGVKMEAYEQKLNSRYRRGYL